MSLKGFHRVPFGMVNEIDGEDRFLRSEPADMAAGLQMLFNPYFLGFHQLVQLIKCKLIPFYVTAFHNGSFFMIADREQGSSASSVCCEKYNFLRFLQNN
jgi:hypothetical protein